MLMFILPNRFQRLVLDKKREPICPIYTPGGLFA